MIKAKDLTARYGHHEVFSHADFEITPGNLSVLLGLNGSGKTTLLRILAGMHRDFSGEVWIGNRNIRDFKGEEISKFISVVLTVPVQTPLRVREVVASGRFPYVNKLNLLKNNDLKKIDEVMDDLDLSRFARRPVTELSDGERQRVMIARALVQDTPVMLLDEPDTHLDITHRAEMLVLLKRIARSGKTVLFSTHYLDLITDIADDVVIIHEGKLTKSAMDTAMENGDFARVFTNDLLIFDKNNRQFKLRK